MYATSTTHAGGSGAERATSRFQSDGRTPQPSRIPGSKLLVRTSLAEARVRHHAADIAAGGAKILRSRIQQVAVGHEVAVDVGPGARHAGRAEHRRGLRHPQRRIRVRIDPGHAGALEVLARADLERGPAGAEEVNSGSHPRRDVLVAVDARVSGMTIGCRQKPRRPFLLLRKPAPRAIEPKGALQRHAAAGPSAPGRTRRPNRRARRSPTARSTASAGSARRC